MTTKGGTSFKGEESNKVYNYKEVNHPQEQEMGLVPSLDEP